MKDEEEEIPLDLPNFMAGYHAGSDFEGKAKIEVSAQMYKNARAKFIAEKFAPQQSNLHLGNRTFGEDKQLALENALHPLNKAYEEQVRTIALKHGYVEPVPKQGPAEKQDAAGKADANQRRNDFAEQLKDIRARQAQQQAARQTARTNPSPPPAETPQEKFRQNWKTIRKPHQP